jgi:hypothetical protein
MEDDFKDYGRYSFFREYPDDPDFPDSMESMDGMQLAMGARGQSAEQREKFEGQTMVDYIGSEAKETAQVVGGGMAEMGAATVKGLGQAFFGLPGDIVMIGRGVEAIINRGGDESKVQAFLRGMQEKTILPTTDDIKKWIDENIVTVGKGDNPMETIGEVLAPGGYVKGAKVVGKGITTAAKEAAPIAGKMVEDYLTKTGVILKAAPDAPAIEVSTAPKLNTPAFKKWFGDSKIVDEKGQPLVVYHGSATGKIEEFNTKGPGRFYGPGAYFAFDAEDAAHYARNAERRNRGIAQTIYPVYLSIKNPMPLDIAMQRKILDRRTKDKNWLKTIIPELKIKMMEAKYDGIILKDNDGKLISAVAFNPEQVKSVFNKGNFNPKDPRILYGGGVAGTGAAVKDKEQK